MIISNKVSRLLIEIAFLYLVSPSHVTISGPSEARQSDTVNFQCTTAPSNPAAEIRWTIDGRQRKTNVSQQIPSNEGGWITSSNISIIVDSNKRSVSLLCQGINMKLADNIMLTHTLNILCKFSLKVFGFWTKFFMNFLWNLFRSSITACHHRLHGRLRYSGWFKSEVDVYVDRWQSASRSHMVQKR